MCRDFENTGGADMHYFELQKVLKKWGFNCTGSFAMAAMIDGK